MSQVFAEIQMSGEPLDWPTTDEAVDALNAHFYETNRGKSLPQVMAEFETSFTQALAATEAMSEADLFDLERFKWRQGRPLWWMVAGNTFAHYDDHIPNIKKWLADQ